MDNPRFCGNDRLAAALFDQDAVGVVVSALDGQWLRANAKMSEILGYDAAELATLDFDRATWPDDAGTERENMARLMAGDIDSFYEEKRYRHMDGSPAWVFVTTSLVRDETGKPEYCLTIVEHIWRRARIREDLRRSEERFNDIASHVPGIIYQFQIDPDGKPTFPYLSPTFQAFCGLPPEEVMADGTIWLDCVHSDDKETLFASIAHSAQTLETWTWEGRMVCPSGPVLWLSGASVPRRLENGGTLWNGMILDVTAWRQAEEQLRQALKMEAVGQLTGGVAHDFNNLLGVIIGHADLLQGETGIDDSSLDAITRAALRGAELTQRLLAFSRRQPLMPRSIDLGALASGMSDLLERTLGATIEIHMVAAPDLWPALADPGQVETALLNLAINSRDAMPDGGRLTIECRNAPLDDSFVANNPETTPGDYVLLAVSDTGSGMSPEVLSHVFEPFFTTKDVGKGSGLGLSMVYGFAKQSGGHVNVYSEPGRGTSVKLYLPRARDARQPTAASAGETAPRGQGETILLIEDDPEVCAMAASMLGTLDYNVVDVPDAAAAEAALRGGDLPALILSDVVLPGGVSGPEFARRAKAAHPGIRIVFMSGYPAEAAIRNGSLESGDGYLSKPFQRGELAAAIRKALDG
jgi:PAS domain S-box-containing protein